MVKKKCYAIFGKRPKVAALAPPPPIFEINRGITLTWGTKVLVSWDSSKFVPMKNLSRLTYIDRWCNKKIVTFVFVYYACVWTDLILYTCSRLTMWIYKHLNLDMVRFVDMYIAYVIFKSFQIWVEKTLS